MHLLHTVTWSWNLRVRLADADANSRVTTVNSRVYRRIISTINLFVFFLNNTGTALPCCPDWRALFRRQRRPRAPRRTWRVTLRSSRYRRRGRSTCTCRVGMRGLRIHSVRLAQDTLLLTRVPVWHGSLHHLSRKDDTSSIIRRLTQRLHGVVGGDTIGIWRRRRVLKSRHREM